LYQSRESVLAGHGWDDCGNRQHYRFPLIGSLAKYAGLTWRRGDSGDFESEDTPITKAGNTYLCYYLGEAANRVRRHIPEYQDYCARKYAEVLKHQHKRALALTFRKLVRPGFIQMPPKVY